ncbi:MAG: undecaprenyl-diphosphate phosphatase [Bryobacteraceae bacterium]|jgi:undecaprenyl-diphosphatase
MPPYPLYQAVILALVQGLTEFLPVSSSAHLDLFPWLLGWEDPGLSFDIALHLGTLVAVLLYFCRDWLRLLAHGFGLRSGGDPDLDANPKLLWWMAAATVPAVIAGLLLHHAAETTLRQPLIYGSTLIGVAVLMLWAEYAARQDKGIGHVGLWDAVYIGVAQAVALIPGVSRSGITITAGLSRGYDRASAARFSFLLSTPAIAGAALLTAYKLHKAGGIPPRMHTAFVVGLLVSAFSGTLVVAFLMRFLRRNTMRIFVLYRVVLGILIIALALFRQ